MAQLAIAGAGALGSSALGFGWQAGWLIGATLGSVLFPPRGPDIEGPRVNDLSVTSSAYGQVIPIGFGTLRMGGNIIWAEEIRERKRTERVGKGGGGQTRTDYSYYGTSYYGTWAVAVSAGPAQAVLRVWGDSKLIHDGGSSGNVEVRGARVSWYRGDEEQLPDPSIEADVGAGDVPGHRGLAYVVIEDLPLEDFGNRLPSVTAEIAFVTAGGVEVVASSLTGEVGTPNEGRVGVDWRRNRVFASATSNPGGIRVLRLSDMAQTNEATATAIFGDGERTNLPVVMPSGRVVLQYGSGNTQPHALIDPVSLEKIGHFPGAGLFPSNSAGGFAFVNNACAAVVNAQGGGTLNLGASRQEFQLSLGGTGSDRMGILQVGARTDRPGELLHYQWHSNDLLPGRGIAFMPGRDNQGVLELHAVSETSGEFGRLRFYRGELRSWETSQGPGGVSFDDDPGVLFPSDILPGASVGRQGGNSFGRARQMLYSVIDEAFVFYWQFDDANGNRRNFIVRWSHHSGLEWAREFPGAGSVANHTTRLQAAGVLG